MFPKVVQVLPLPDFTVYVYFEDGKIVCYNASSLLTKAAFLPLNNPELFLNACTVLNDTLAWDLQGDRDPAACLDIDPDTLYALPHVEDAIA